MTPPLFHMSTSTIPDIGELATLSGDEGRHAVSVRRIQPGEPITLGDGKGLLAAAEVEAVKGKDTLQARIIGRKLVPRPKVPVTLIQALPKSDRSELAVELATEAGVDVIVPWQADRSISRWDASKKSASRSFSPSDGDGAFGDGDVGASSEKARKGVHKWRKTAASAAKQARRPWIPDVKNLVGLPGVLELVDKARVDGAVAMLHESARLGIATLPVERAKQIVLIVGPEGGLTEREHLALEEAGAKAVILGPEVLRTSTAAAVAMGALGVLTGRWKNRH